MKQVKQIVFEVEETVVLRSGETTAADFCPICEKTVAMATPWIAAKIHGASERQIFRLIEHGVVHVNEEERLLMCLSCIARERSESIARSEQPNAGFENAIQVRGTERSNVVRDEEI